MKNIKVGMMIPKIRLSNANYNADEIIKHIKDAASSGVKIISTYELALTGYTCGDLFKYDFLIESAEKALMKIVNETKELDIVSIIGMPVNKNGRVYSAAAVIEKGVIKSIVADADVVLEKDGVKFAVRVGARISSTHPSCYACHLPFIREGMASPMRGSCHEVTDEVEIIFNLVADPEIIGSEENRREYACVESQNSNAVFVLVNAGPNESTSSVVYSGHSIIAKAGKILAETNMFELEGQSLYFDVNIEKTECKSQIKLKGKNINMSMYPFVPEDEGERKRRCKKIVEIQSTALAKRMSHTHSEKAVIGLSGGLDSTLAFLVTVKAFEKLNYDRKNIVAITMPGFGTTGRTFENACKLAKECGADLRIIDIKEACEVHFKDIGIEVTDRTIAYENTQARERTQILMDVANNENGIVIGTGNLSEAALGWSTYNGDHMSMYAVNANIPKTLLRDVVKEIANETDSETLKDILDTPISPELLPPDENGNMIQMTETSIGPYVLHDFFLYHFIRWHASPSEILKRATKIFEGKYSVEEIKKWLEVFIRKFFIAQFKRNCVPDGPRVGSVSLNSKEDFVMPSDIDGTMWKEEVYK